MVMVLGIDPGTTDVGFAVILGGHKREIVTFGVIHTTPKAPQSKKLREIMDDLETILQKYPIKLAAVEKLYFTTNIKTGIDVAQSRGVVLALLEKYGIPILEYTPLQVKKALCGNGKAPKKQIGKTVQMLYRLSDIPQPDDAADALGIAYIASLSL